MSLLPNLATVKDVVDRLGATLNNAEKNLVQSLIERAEAIIEQFTGRDFSSHEKTAKIDGNKELEFWYVPDKPLISVTSIISDGDTLVEDTDFWVYPDKGYIRFVKGILNDADPRNVVITYKWGYSTIPKGIIHICTEMAINGFNNYRADKMLEGAVSGSFADFNIRFEKKALLSEDLERELYYYRELLISSVG